MSDFQKSLKDSGLGETFASSSYAKWGNFTQEAADLIVEIHDLERISCELLSITWMNESVFNLYPVPNTNGSDENWFGFDIGWGQLNLGWTLRMAWQGEIRTNDLLFVDVFGKPPYRAGESFTGNPLAHGRIVARRLLMRPKILINDRMRAVAYTGPKAQPYRGQSYDKFEPLFKNFFDLYLKKE